MKRKYIDYFFIFLLLAFSGNPIFTSNKLILPIFSLIFILFYLLRPNKFPKSSGKNLLIYIFFFVTVFIAQRLILDYVSWVAVVNFCCKIIFGAFIISYIGAKFRKEYFNVMCFLTLIGLAFFIMNSLGITLPSLITQGRNHSLIIYNQCIQDSLMARNSGMFWEPGAYAGYLLFIPLIYIDNLHELFINNKKKCIILIIGFISTFSTMGYVVISLIVIYVLLFKTRNKILSFMSIVIFLIFISYIFTKADFLSNKIQHQYETSLELGIGEEFKPDRFGQVMFDIYYIKKHPIIGNGLSTKTRFADHQDLVLDSENSGILNSGNGFSGFIGSMGLLSIIVYFIVLFRILPFTKPDKVFFIISIILLLQGEYFLNYPFLLAIPFIHIYNEKKIKLATLK